MNKHMCSAVLAGLSLLPFCGCGQTGSSAADAAAETASSSETTVTAAPESDAEPVVTTHFRGGIGSEKNAETPLPEYFTYRFQPSGISVRLAGGTYQAISYDFSEIYAESHSLSQDYYLDDYDGDGSYDLYIPSKYGQDAIEEYSVFLWDPAAQKFNTEPVFTAPEPEGANNE